MNHSAPVRRLLIIAPPGSYRLAPFLKATRSLNLTPLIASVSSSAMLPAGCDGIHINLSKPEQALQDLLDLAQKTPFIGILGTDDATIELASQAASRLNLPHNPVEAARFTQRKDLARAHLQQAGLNVPWFKVISIHQDISQLADLPYPVVIKPLNLSASRGVIRANNATELAQAIIKVKPIILDTYEADAKENILIEQYIQGVEIALECLLDADKLITIAFFDKPDPLEGPYFEETYYITPSRLAASILKNCEQEVLRCCQAYGLRTGPIHAEIRIDENNTPWILEVAARTIGGDCAQSLKPSGNYSLEELVISFAIGEPIIPEPQQTSTGVLMIPVPKAGILKRVEGILEAQKVPNITSLSIDVMIGSEVHCLPESSSYLGFIFAEAESPALVEQALRTAHNKLSVIIQPVWVINTLNDIN